MHTYLNVPWKGLPLGKENFSPVGQIRVQQNDVCANPISYGFACNSLGVAHKPPLEGLLKIVTKRG